MIKIKIEERWISESEKENPLGQKQETRILTQEAIIATTAGLKEARIV